MTAKAKERKKRNSADRSVGGTYVYDKEQGKLVKVSDRVPKVASKRGGSPSPSDMPCGGGGCGGGGDGACGMA